MATAANQHDGSRDLRLSTLGLELYQDVDSVCCFVFCIHLHLHLPFHSPVFFFLCFSGIDCNYPVVALDYPFAIILVLTLVIYPFLVADQARRIDLIHLFALLHPCNNFLICPQ